MDITGQEVSKSFTSGLLHKVHRDGIRESERLIWKSDWSRARSVRGHTLRLLYLQGEARLGHDPVHQISILHPRLLSLTPVLI